jgi:hypothetical protein
VPLYLERWLTAHWRWRLLSWLLAALLTGAGARLLTPGETSAPESHIQVLAQIREHRRLLRKLTPLANIREQLRLPAPEAAQLPFSALGLSRESHVVLMNWQPAKPISELTLEVSWACLPALFMLLGKQRIEPVGFTLQMHKQALTLTLRLGGVE